MLEPKQNAAEVTSREKTERCRNLCKPMTRSRRFLFAMGILVAVDVGCARHAKPAADPDAEHIQRLAASAFGVLQTNGYSYAFVTGHCGPTDGPGMALYLLDQRHDAVPPTTKYIRVRIWQEADSLAHQKVQWQESRGPGDADICSAGSCAAMKSGHIDFGTVKAGSR